MVKSKLMNRARRRVRRIVRKKRAQRKAVIPRNGVTVGSGFPKKMCITLTYYDSQTLTSTAGAVTNYQFSCNSIYDPNTTGTGHQPLYRDQMAAIYNHYTVIGSRCQYSVMGTATNNLPGALCAFINDDTTTLEASPFLNAERPRARLSLLGAGGDHAIRGTLNWSAKKAFGKGVLSNTELATPVGQNPGESEYFSFQYRTVDFSTTTSVHLIVKITYIVVFNELQDIASS